MAKSNSSSARGRDTEFGERLRRLRTRLGLSQREFATRYGLNVRSLEKWELATRKPAEGILSYIIVIESMPNDVAERLEQAALEEAEQELLYNPSRE